MVSFALALGMVSAACSDVSQKSGAPSLDKDAGSGTEGGSGTVAADAGTDGHAGPPLSLVLPPASSVDEEKTLVLTVKAQGGASAARVFVEGLPEGATWDQSSGTLSFTPDFTQGGHAWDVSVTADDGAARVHGTVHITANDVLLPRAPTVTSTTAQNGYATLHVSQITDSFLDSPGYAGRTFDAVVIAPTAGSAQNKLPVRVGLHGFAGTPSTDGWSGEYRIYPADPNDTYWWGYADSLPSAGAPTAGHVPEYTARRVLHLLAWLLSTYPGADPERVYLDGISMGGAGAMTMGLLHARHFCHARASFGQAIPRNHRPSRVTQLTPLWGAPASNLDDGYGMAAWDRMDLTRALNDVPEGRDQFLTLKHSKDDVTIHFGAVVMPSPLTKQTFYGALQATHVGHHAVWDEGGHVINDPVLGDQWWTAGWDPVFDATALLRLHRAFPAFSAASVDRNPGTGKGNGKVPWNAESGYAGNVSVAGDTGWDGDIAGGINRFLRWDGTLVEDTLDAFKIPLRALDGTGGAPPRAGYPTTGDKLDGTAPVMVDVTPRRVQSFRLRPGEHVAWSFGAASGIANADSTGAVTIPRLAVTTTWTTLSLSRAK
jgi:hypothetical protein